MRRAFNSQQDTALTGGRLGIRNMPNVSYVTHGTCEEDAKGGVCLRGPSRTDQPNTIKRHPCQGRKSSCTSKIFSFKVQNGLASVQYLESSFSSVRQVNPFSSVHSFHFTNSSALTRFDLAGSFRLRLDSVNRVSNCLGEADEQFLVLQRKSQPVGPRFVAWVEGWCTLLAVLTCLSGMWNVVGVTQIQFIIVL